MTSSELIINVRALLIAHLTDEQANSAWWLRFYVGWDAIASIIEPAVTELIGEHRHPAKAERFMKQRAARSAADLLTVNCSENLPQSGIKKGVVSRFMSWTTCNMI